MCAPTSRLRTAYEGSSKLYGRSAASRIVSRPRAPRVRVRVRVRVRARARARVRGRGRVGVGFVRIRRRCLP